MTARVEVAPAMLAWARERSGKGDTIQSSFPKLPEWEAGTVLPTFRQLEDFAKATYTPLGYFFLPAPPDIPLPIPDMRTVGSLALTDPSPNLLDTISLCMDRQEWYRSYLLDQGAEPLPFVGSLEMTMPPRLAADRMLATLGFDVDARAEAKTREDALRLLVRNAEASGILVMISGVVGANTHRPLDPSEFRGFALADPYAPVVFVNGADAKNAQNFTLVHELVHVWLGGSALTGGADQGDAVSGEGASVLEVWVNAVAAEFLIPAGSLVKEFARGCELASEARRLAREFKVSPEVILRRLRDTNLISWDACADTLATFREAEQHRPASGGDFYRTTPVRVSRPFARAVIASTLEGRTLYRDAFRLLGFRSQKAFDGLSHELGLV
ncbi:MAG: ImmA/IrrE family metallo-endopeptidase [Thermomicrobiales bacterium]